MCSSRSEFQWVKSDLDPDLERPKWSLRKENERKKKEKKGKRKKKLQKERRISFTFSEELGVLSEEFEAFPRAWTFFLGGITNMKYQCCWSGSGIRCLFDPRIRCLFDPSIQYQGRIKIKIRIRDEHPRSYFRGSLETIFWVKILKFFDANPDPLPRSGNLFDPGSGKEKIRINIPDPQHWQIKAFKIKDSRKNLHEHFSFFGCLKKPKSGSTTLKLSYASQETRRSCSFLFRDSRSLVRRTRVVKRRPRAAWWPGSRIVSPCFSSAQPGQGASGSYTGR